MGELMRRSAMDAKEQQAFDENVTRLVLEIQSEINAEANKVELWTLLKDFVTDKVFSQMPFTIPPQKDTSYDTRLLVKQYYADSIGKTFREQHIMAQKSVEEWNQPYIYQYSYNASDNVGFCAFLENILKHPFAIYEPQATELALMIQKGEDEDANKRALSNLLLPFLVKLMKSHKSSLISDYGGSDAEQEFVDAANDFIEKHIMKNRSEKSNPYVYKYDFSKCDSFCGYIKIKLLPATKKNGVDEVIWDNFAKRVIQKNLGNPNLTKGLQDQSSGNDGEQRFDAEVEQAIYNSAILAYENEQADITIRDYAISRPRYYIPYIQKVNELDWDKIQADTKYKTYATREKVINEHKILAYHLLFIIADLDFKKSPHNRDNGVTRKFTSLLTEPAESSLGGKSLSFWQQKVNAQMQIRLHTSENLMSLLEDRLKYRSNGDIPLVDYKQNIREAHLRWVYDTMAPKLDNDYKQMKLALITNYVEVK